MTADVTIDTGTTVETTEAFAVPEMYAEKPWAANVKSLDDVYAQFDSAQGMIGKKTLPGADASPDELKEFYAQLTPETYELSLPEGVEAEISDEQQIAYKDFFKANGFSQKQAQALYEFHIGQELSKVPTPEQKEAREAELNTEFDAKLKEKYGDKADDVVKTVLQHALEHGSETKAAIATMNNEQMLATVDLVNHMHNKIPSKAEDGAPEPGASTTGATLEDKVAAANRLRREAGQMDPFNPEFNSTRERLKNLDDEIKRAYK